MASSALFVGGQRSPARFFQLALHRFRQNGSNLRVTAGATAAAGGESWLHEARPDGIEGKTGFVTLPHILLRVANAKACESARLLLTVGELKAVGREFGIPYETALGSLFERKEDCIDAPTLGVAPDWSSLLALRWRRAFYACLEQPTPERVPRPNWLPWRTQPGFVELPGLPQKFSLEGAPLDAKFWVSTVDGMTKLDLTRTNRELLLSVLIRRTTKGWDIQRLNISRGSEEAATTINETFNPILFGKMMVPLAQLERAKYCFSKRAGKRDFRLTPDFPGQKLRTGNLEARLVLNFGCGTAIEEGQLCHFTMVRNNGFLNAACYRDKAGERLLGLATWTLDEDGLPRNQMRTLGKPDGSAPDWLAHVSDIMSVEG